MLLNLAELALRGGERYDRAYPVELDPIVLGGVDYRVLIPGGVRVDVDRVKGGYLVQVALDAKIYGPCTRCLAEAAIDLHAEQQEFAPTAKDGWGETEGSEFIRDLIVDVEGLAREAVILALPGQITCSEQCRGLCPRCGTDLNGGPCGCDQEESDERWSRLKDLHLGKRGADSAEGKARGDAKA